jgi:hypothetical protein
MKRLAAPALILPDRIIHRCTSEQSWGMLQSGIPGAGAAAMQHGIGGGGGAAVAISVGGSAAARNGASTYTFTGVAIGAADPARYVLACIAGTDVGSISSVTVAGQACSIIQSQTNVSTTVSAIAITTAPLASGTTATIVINFAAAASDAAVFAYSIKNLASITPTATAFTTTNNGSLPIAVSAGGAAVGLGGAGANTLSGGSISFANYSTDSSFIYPGSGPRIYAGVASKASVAGETADFQCTIGDNFRPVFVAAALR